MCHTQKAIGFYRKYRFWIENNLKHKKLKTFNFTLIFSTAML